jgi:hypothetical protein
MHFLRKLVASPEGITLEVRKYGEWLGTGNEVEETQSYQMG